MTHKEHIAELEKKISELNNQLAELPIDPLFLLKINGKGVRVSKRYSVSPLGRNGKFFDEEYRVQYVDVLK